MQTEQQDERVTSLDQDIWSGKMSQEHSVATKGKTSKPSLRKSLGSQTQMRPTSLCLTSGGQNQDASMMKWGGWSIAWRVHDAQFWGVPQRRKRIALVADFGGLSAPEVLFERKGLSRDFESGEEAWKGFTAGVGSGIGKTERLSSQRMMVFGIDQQGGKGQATYTENISPTIASDSHGTPHAVAYEPTMIEMTSTKNTIVEDGTSPTLTARMGTGGNQVNAIYRKEIL